MISPAAIAEDGKVTEPVGTGPFKRESWDPGEEMVLVRNEDYWGELAKLERITLKFIPDPTTRMMALETGEIQMIIDTGGVLPEHVSTLLLHPEIEVMTIPGAVPHYLSLNTAKAPLDDVKVRQAVVHAIDPESIINFTLEGYGKPMTSVIPHSEQDWLHPQSLYAFNDPARAKELLQEAGWQEAGGSGVLQKNGEELSLKILLSSALVGRWPYMPMAEIMQARYYEIFSMVKAELTRLGRSGMLPAGAVLTGAAVKAPGVLELARDVLGLPVQMGFPVEVGGVIEKVDDPAYATALGTLVWGLKEGSQYSPMSSFQMKRTM